MVSTYYPPRHFGGDAVFVQALSRALVRQGHQVDVICCDDAFQLGHAQGAQIPAESGMDDDGVRVHRLRTSLGRLSLLITQQTGLPGWNASSLARILDRPFDVVNFHNISLVGGPGVLRMSKAPVNLYTLHEHWLICPTHILWKNREAACEEPRTCLRCSIRSGVPPQLWRYGSLIPDALKHVDLILSPSEFTAREHREGGIATPIHVLPTFSPLPGDEPAARVLTESGRPRFLFAGRVTRSKGIEMLVEQFAQTPEYDLDVVGTGDLLETLQTRYRQSPWIRFRGHVANEGMGDWYRAATALILPSIAPEVFPLCTMEAFSYGTPVIVSDAGGAPEAVQHSGGGFVFRNATELRDALTQLATQPELRARLGALGRQAFEETYSEERYLRDYLAVVDGIQEKKRRAASAAAKVSRTGLT